MAGEHRRIPCKLTVSHLCSALLSHGTALMAAHLPLLIASHGRPGCESRPYLGPHYPSQQLAVAAELHPNRPPPASTRGKLALAAPSYTTDCGAAASGVCYPCDGPFLANRAQSHRQTLALSAYMSPTYCTYCVHAAAAAAVGAWRNRFEDCGTHT
jgi:hypothetical protein